MLIKFLYYLGDDQIPKYKIKVVYSVTNVHSYQDDCPKKYGTELFHKIQNLSVAVCSDSFMLLPSITLHQVINVFWREISAWYTTNIRYSGLFSWCVNFRLFSR